MNKINLVGDSFNPNHIVSKAPEIDTKNNKRIWTTEKVNNYIEQMNKGREDTSNSPFFENEFGWRKAGLTFEYTQEEWDEFIRCSEDINHFAETYCQIKTGEQFTNFELYDYQKDFFDSVIEDKNVVYLASRQIGKCITPHTKIDIKIDGKVSNGVTIIDLYKNLYPDYNKGILNKIKNFLWMLYSKL